MDNVLIVGAGKLGTVLFLNMTKNLSNYVYLGDINTDPILDNAHKLDLMNITILGEFCKNREIQYLINTTGIKGVNLFPVVELCNSLNINYIDINYDEKLEAMVSDLSLNIAVALGAGVAPGMVNIIAADMIKETKLTELHLLEVHSSSLSVNSDTYNLFVPTYNPEDISDEYFNVAKFVENNEIKIIEPFKNGMKKNMIINNHNYEAFLTSGSFSTFFDSFKDIVPNIISRTLRPPGHYDIICEQYTAHEFVNLPPVDASDIILSVDRGRFCTDLENSRIEDVDDEVVIYITLTGTKIINGKSVSNTEYRRFIYSRLDFPYGSAIDNVCSINVMTTFRAIWLGVIRNTGILKQETIPINFLHSTFGLYV